MSDRFEDRAAVAGKIAWEGGIWEALTYGIRADDMPEGDEELQDAWLELRTVFEAAQLIWERVYDMLPEVDG